MQVEYVVTLFGTDRPGVIESVSTTVAKYGGNWQESQMTRLAGRFSGIVCIRCPQSNAKPLEEALAALARDGLELRVEQSHHEEPPESIALQVDLVGHDRPGILGELARALSTRNVNIVDLHTECTSAPMSGEMLFHAHAELLCPAGLTLDQLRESLEELGQNLMVDVNVDPVDAS